jgi:hypothetical protein
MADTALVVLAVLAIQTLFWLIILVVCFVVARLFGHTVESVRWSPYRLFTAKFRPGELEPSKRKGKPSKVAPAMRARKVGAKSGHQQ